MKNKKGITILELLVSMTIFIMVVTIAVGAFVSVSRMRALTGTMKESQQKLRVALEMISRLSRQAAGSIVATRELTLYFPENTFYTATKFVINGTTLEYSECGNFNVATANCVDGWSTPNNLLGGSVQLTNASGFTRKGTIPPSMEVVLEGSVPNQNVYYQDDMYIKTTIILENEK